MADPLKYYGNNTCQTRSLLAACAAHGVQRLVFSSTAAVYGIPATGICAEDSVLQPINPYGTSKLMSEWMLRDVAASSPLRYVALRYFNVAGSDTSGRIGQANLKAQAGMTPLASSRHTAVPATMLSTMLRRHQCSATVTTTPAISGRPWPGPVILIPARA